MIATPIHHETNDRQYWISQLQRVAEPVLLALQKQRLKQEMPVESQAGVQADRESFTHLEALGRLLSGVAPWLELDMDDQDDQDEHSSGKERELQQQYRVLARAAIAAGTDPASADYMNFSEGAQPIVDTAFLAQAILRAPKQLWHQLEPQVQKHVVQALKATRSRKPYANNWLLFSAMIETALFVMGEQDWDPMRIDYALKQHEQWYKGDGAYGDGMYFHWDYYNSFVIQPMLVDILNHVAQQDAGWKAQQPVVNMRARRYAAVLERMIAPDGSFPPIGRSLAYRCGAFQSLAQSALLVDLPEGVTGGSARSALTAVIQRTLEAPNTFDEKGWLTIGLAGHQPDLGETYISTGSLYLCATAFLPLGLPAAHPFWREEASPWTSQLVWSGQASYVDTALYP